MAITLLLKTFIDTTTVTIVTEYNSYRLLKY